MALPGRAVLESVINPPKRALNPEHLTSGCSLPSGLWISALGALSLDMDLSVLCREAREPFPPGTGKASSRCSKDSADNLWHDVERVLHKRKRKPGCQGVRRNRQIGKCFATHVGYRSRKLGPDYVPRCVKRSVGTEALKRIGANK
ncbi:unnamed protein product [Tuber aestivum]|uniref:Uncharacterized protein n=1 Tax=Tuber aestivum TaxID=59557 RepID=A0A292Q2C1_9PEZI|nr:unnamed protein product [Tuber aestivum]